MLEWTVICSVAERIHGITGDNNGSLYFTTRTRLWKYDSKELKILAETKYTKFCRELIYHENKLLICDSDSGQVIQWNFELETFEDFLGRGKCKDKEIEEGFFFHPFGITTDKNGNIYVTDNHRVHIINTQDGTWITAKLGTIPEMLMGGYRNGSLAEACFKKPSGCVVTEDGIVYVCDYMNHCIRKIENGIVSTLTGHPHREGATDGTLAEASFSYPCAMGKRKDGSLVVCDKGSSLFRRIDIKRGTVTSYNMTYKTQSSAVYIDENDYMYFVSDGKILGVESTWRWRRYLWLGLLKEDASYCYLAKLPQDIIRYISSFI